jgi:hypothetical protein
LTLNTSSKALKPSPIQPIIDPSHEKVAENTAESMLLAIKIPVAPIILYPQMCYFGSLPNRIEKRKQA